MRLLEGFCLSGGWRYLLFISSVLQHQKTRLPPVGDLLTSAQPSRSLRHSVTLGTAPLAIRQDQHGQVISAPFVKRFVLSHK